MTFSVPGSGRNGVSGNISRIFLSLFAEKKSIKILFFFISLFNDIHVVSEINSFSGSNLGWLGFPKACQGSKFKFWDFFQKLRLVALIQMIIF